jgi:hypothetical protein
VDGDRADLQDQAVKYIVAIVIGVAVGFAFGIIIKTQYLGH